MSKPSDIKLASATPVTPRQDVVDAIYYVLMAKGYEVMIDGADSHSTIITAIAEGTQPNIRVEVCHCGVVGRSHA